MQSRLFRSSSRRLRQVMQQRIFSTAPAKQESFLNGSSSVYAEYMYELYQADPNSVEPSWKSYFDALERGQAISDADFNRPTMATSPQPRRGVSVAVRANIFEAGRYLAFLCC
jgi:2-oxoglutarate dehydrogenase E1 component